jgi:single-strand DNA-binding protein
MAFGRSIVFDGAIYPNKKGQESIDLAFGASGKAYSTFTVATYGGKKSQDETKDKIYHRCVAFGDLAEHIAESLKPGDEVIVVGTMESNNWTDTDGKKRYGLQIVVDMLGISLRWDTGKSDKMWTAKPQSTGADGGPPPQSAPKQRASSGGPMEAPFDGRRQLG